MATINTSDNLKRVLEYPIKDIYFLEQKGYAITATSEKLMELLRSDIDGENITSK